MKPKRSFPPRLAIAFATVALALAGCSFHSQTAGVPIDERPSPPPPQQSQPPKAAVQDTAPLTTSQLTPSAEESLRAMAAKDTAVVSAVLQRCAGKDLLPEQETTYDATVQLLAQTRDAMIRGDLTRARSLARNARQLSTSLECE